VLELIDWLRQLDARFVAAVTSQGPMSETESRVANVLGALGIVLAAAAALLLPPHGVVQTALVCTGLLMAVPYLHGLFEKVLVALRA
jgi:hypothetical protein